MKVRQAMNINAVRVLIGTTVRKAAEITAFSSVSDLIVIDSENNFLGVLSEGDLMRAALPSLTELVEHGNEASLPDAYDLFSEKGQQLSERPVDELVIKDPLTVSPEDHIQKAAALMAARNIRRLPVVERGKLAGTISRADVCRAVFR